MKINQLNLAAIIFTFILLITCGCKKDNTSKELHEEEIPIEDQALPYFYPDWMSEIDGSLYLTQFTIPGTHDSGADLHTSYLGNNHDVICQHFSIPNQLILGIRWLDIRADLNFLGHFRIVHSIFDLNKDLRDVLDYCIEFLDHHPTETIVLMIKQASLSYSVEDFGNYLLHVLKEKGLEHFFLENRVPSLDEVRSKIVIVRRFQNETGHPLGIYTTWDDNTTGKDYWYEPTGWYVQDYYSVKDSHIPDKISYIKNTITHARNNIDYRKFHLNFVSCEYVPWHYLYHTAIQVNVPIAAYFKDQLPNNIRKCGVIMINFAGGTDVDSGPRNCVPWFVMYILQQNGI